MTVYAQVPELSAVYTITGPDGTQAVINNSASANYVGTFSQDGLTGLDSAEIRENAWSLVEADGGVHGPFWLDRRPVTLSVEILGTSAADRNAKMQRFKLATGRALRADGVLSWTTPNGGGPNQQVSFRTQQPVRESGAWLKTGFVGLVCADPRIYSTTINTKTQVAADGNQTWTNQGDYPAPPSLRINGPGTNPTVTLNNALSIVFNNLVLTAGQYVVIDLVQRTITDQGGTNRFGAVDFLNTAWWMLPSGDSSVKIAWVSGNTAASTLVGTWRDTWV